MSANTPKKPSKSPATPSDANLAEQVLAHAQAKVAGIPNQATIRDIEQGKDVKFSNLRAVADALGLELDLVEKVA